MCMLFRMYNIKLRAVLTIAFHVKLFELSLGILYFIWVQSYIIVSMNVHFSVGLTEDEVYDVLFCIGKK